MAKSTIVAPSTLPPQSTQPIIQGLISNIKKFKKINVPNFEFSFLFQKHN
jgi:hypothetical protein